MKRHYNLILMILTVLVLGSCEQDEPEVKTTKAYPMTGEWWVQVYADDGAGNLEDASGGYIALLTFNTASDGTDSLWITDVGNFWDFQVKAGMNYSGRSFATDEAVNFNYDDSFVKITNGKIIEGGGLSTSKVKTDSIYFEAAFSDDSEPYATKYVFRGVRRTGFLEDEH
jgi:hypothetical protein